MKIPLTIAAALLVGACAAPAKPVGLNERLDRIEERLAELEKKPDRAPPTVIVFNPKPAYPEVTIPTPLPTEPTGWCGTPHMWDLQDWIEKLRPEGAETQE